MTVDKINVNWLGSLAQKNADSEGRGGGLIMANDGRPTPGSRKAFARRLQEAINRTGLTYEETARRAREHLPADARLSSVSVWQYANGKTFPRQVSYLEALGKALEIPAEDLLSAEENGHSAGGDPLKPHDSQVRVEDLGHGRARLTVSADLPWPTALKVLSLLKGVGTPGD
jgi:transcriptional regulator with XRE-family HTH domain